MKFPKQIKVPRKVKKYIKNNIDKCYGADCTKFGEEDILLLITFKGRFRSKTLYKFKSWEEFHLFGMYRNYILYNFFIQKHK